MQSVTENSSFFKNESTPSREHETFLSAFEPNVMLISDSLTERLQSDRVDVEEIIVNDNYWMDKLSSLDATHSKERGLSISEAEKVLKNILNYTEKSDSKACLPDQSKVARCYAMNKDATLRCNVEVDHFITCVNTSLHNAVRLDLKNVLSKKKDSYIERFKRGY